MANLTTKSIRNVALLGHGGSGKTTLAEAMLYGSGTIDRFGRTPDGTTICDYDTEEIRRGFSLSLATANLTWKDIKINVLDTPGYLDFSGEVLEGVRVADAAVITIDGKAGLEVGAELAWDYAVEAGIPSEDVFMDHAGFSTYESMVRAKEVFQAKKIIIVTQEYHLNRALYLAHKLGLEAYGVPADLRNYSGQFKRDIREIAARCKDFALGAFKPKPTYLGDIIPISGDGNATND